MPRKRVVSRTIKTTNAEVLVVDKKTKRTKTISVSVAGSYPSDRYGTKRLEKKIEKILPEDQYKMVMVEKQEVVTALYSMPEEDFLEHATIQKTNNKEKKGKKKQ